MANEITINGKKIRTNKEIRSINNTRVTFSDGSWCDVKTNSVRNIGSGYIEIDGVQTSSEGSETSPSSTEQAEHVGRAAVTSVKVKTILSTIKVEPHRGEEVEYTLVGPQEVIDAIGATIQEVNGTLVIKDEGIGASSSFGGAVFSNGQNRTVIGGKDGITIGGVFGTLLGGIAALIDGDEDTNLDVTITLKVPRGTALEIDSMAGDVTVGATHGPLKLSVKGGSATVEQVSRAELAVAGNGDIEVQRVDGDVVATVQGNGGIQISDGAFPTLTAVVQGNGDITVGGIALAASLTIQGNGDITVAHVKTRPTKIVQGRGDIEVGRIG